jgi:Thioredoxin
MNQKILTPSMYREYFEKGINFETYFENMVENTRTNTDPTYGPYLAQNLQRVKRLMKTTKVTEVLRDATMNLRDSVKWLVISEHWCGDAAQILPVLYAIAAASGGRIDLRIVYRDQNEPLIAAHLTNGTKSIPKLVQLDADYRFISEWGPRPVEAQHLVQELKANPATALDYADKLHKWYADDKTMSTQRELLQTVQSIAGSTVHTEA